MEDVISEWDKMGILKEVMQRKLLFLETKDVVETTFALDNFHKACNSGRGAVFFSVARGKVAEGIDFDRHYGRCVLLFGIPYQYTLSQVLKARLTYMRDSYSIRDDDFLTFDALRQSAQCIGRVIRSKTDYGIVILADSRYNRQDTRQRFPNWIKQFVRDSYLNLTTDVAIEQMKTFLRVMGQSIDHSQLRKILYNEKEIREKLVQGYRLQQGVPPAGGQGQGGQAQEHLLQQAHIQQRIAGVVPVVQEFEAIAVPQDPQDQIDKEVNADAMDVDEAYIDEMEMYLDESHKTSSHHKKTVFSEEELVEKSKMLRSSLFLFEDILD